MINIVSYGAGQNSTAMIINMIRDSIKIDEIIFADPMGEMPETYTFLKEFRKWCIKKKLSYTRISGGNLLNDYTEKRIIPFRMFRSCTDHYKVRVIKKYLKAKYGNQEIIQYLGIDSSEQHRAEKFNKEIFKFPLIDQNIDREGCKTVIRKEGLSVPVKSGCFFCPFQSVDSWIQLFIKHPLQYEMAVIFEKNCRRYPESTLMGKKTLESLKIAIQEQKGLNDFDKSLGLEKCVFCHN